MSIQSEGGLVPEFDLPDRMRKALRTAGVGVQEMADYLGVARNTVGSWINGHIEPSVQTQRLWALRTGVSYAWLRGDFDELVRHQGLEPRTRWLSEVAA